MALQADVHGLSARDVVLPIVPMFHANAWGLPFSAPAVGAKLVMPGANLDPAVLAETIELEEVTFATGVPTVMQGLIDHYRATRTRPGTLKRVIIGGARCPERIIEEFEDVLGVEVVHGWGMTELSPIGTMNVPRRTPAWQSPEERNTIKARQGRPPLGVDLRLVGDDGQPVPHDGKTSGHLCVKGWAAVAHYYGEDDTALDADGYFDTGDIATIDPRRVHGDNGPREGLGQIGRRVDQLAGDRASCAEPSRGGDGGSDRRPPSEVGRAPASHHPAIRGHERDG